MAKRKPKEPDEHLEITVWDHEGNIVKKLWDATWDDYEHVKTQFEDDPLKTVVVDER
jgi:hypothetical protein